MSEWDGFTYKYDPTPVEPLIKEGVTEGWVIIHSGEAGPASAIKVQALADGEVVSLVQDGEWQDVTIVDHSDS